MKIAILTNFAKIVEGYSLTGLTFDQARMLTANGDEVHFYLSERFEGDAAGFADVERYGGDPRAFFTHARVPYSDLVDYKSRRELSESHKLYVQRLTEFFLTELADFDMVFTHDYVFTGWNMPYALALMNTKGRMEQVKWLHWVHSIPSQSRDWWNIREYGTKHRIVFPNSADKLIVTNAFRAKSSQIKIIPHIKDLRSFADFRHETCLFIYNYPKVMQADVVVIYPASTDRLEAKRLREVILIMSQIKKRGFSVCLVVPNQWARGSALGPSTASKKQDILNYQKIASRNGLKVGDEFIFTSEWLPEYGVGVPMKMIQELMMLGNVFIFPTREESFGLVAPEASLAGGALLVMNRSLESSLEVTGMFAVYAKFGSFTDPDFKPENEREYYKALAALIIERYQRNESIMVKTWCRQRYNWDSLYNKRYAPIFAESASWA